MILDMGLPDLDGLAVVSQIREWSKVPIIILSVQGQEYSQYLRIYISQLRKKIEKDPNQPKYILTEPGVGYRLAVLE